MSQIQINPLLCNASSLCINWAWQPISTNRKDVLVYLPHFHFCLTFNANLWFFSAGYQILSSPVKSVWNLKAEMTHLATFVFIFSFFFIIIVFPLERLKEIFAALSECNAFDSCKYTRGDSHEIYSDSRTGHRRQDVIQKVCCWNLSVLFMTHSWLSDWSSSFILHRFICNIGEMQKTSRQQKSVKQKP